MKVLRLRKDQFVNFITNVRNDGRRQAEDKGERWKVYNIPMIARGCKSWGISWRHATKVNTATRTVPGARNLYFSVPLQTLFISLARTPLYRPLLLLLSDHKFSSFSAAAIPGTARSNDTSVDKQGPIICFLFRLPIMISLRMTMRESRWRGFSKPAS